ncbi:MAG: hypothetical protein C0609_04265 [Deltaproteobacteria bacterium]|nr:MAG: hypothetical protein C0609_04265 [Deltaproteobacteria bacterium]
MLDVRLDEMNEVLHLTPDAPLSEADFDNAVKVVDPFIEKHGALRGVVIEAERFPGWDSFGGLVAHLRFVRDHHEKVKRVAIVTDSAFGTFAEKVGSHFVSAEVRHFDSGELKKAEEWAAAGGGA